MSNQHKRLGEIVIIWIRTVWLRLLLAPVLGISFLVVWAAVVEADVYTNLVLPSPGEVAERWYELYADGLLWRHTEVTLYEVFFGLGYGVLVAFVTGYFIAKSRIVASLLTPYLVALQAVPIVAVAPLLIIWFGPETQSKVIICALLVFFPMLVNTVIGMRSIPPDLRDLLRSLQANPLETFWYLELPAALPVVIGGLKVSATLSVIGAVVGEFVSPNEGLGYLIATGRGNYDTPQVIATVLTLTALALLLYGLATLLEYALLSWQRAGNNGL
ncbi:MAG: ABC transporter permease [Chloroflexi bacterium]|nr:ABC transporter permease [Chloroflexota bacterium]